MQVRLNGEIRQLSDALTLKKLLEELQINPYTVVVEHNENVIKRDLLENTSIEDGDQIEIVQFIGGGSPAAKKKKSSTASHNGATRLVIVESPAKAKTINKYLGNDYQVEASMGHVRDLPKSKMGVDLTQDFTPNYVIVAKARKTVSHLKKQAKNKQEIYLAPDPDREGEAISWHLAHIFNELNPDGNVLIRRVVFNEITKDAVQEAFKHPRDIKMNLVNAQQARRVLDRVVGYELSPLLWKKVGRGLSAGRVQSVALRLIVDREREIRKFVPQEYWSIEAKLSSESSENAGKVFLSKLEKVNGEKAELKERDQTEAIRQEILTLPFTVQKVDKNERRRRPQAPFSTSKLQQEAYSRLGFPASKTMRVAQSLYEGVDIGEEGTTGLITYMRTDSVNVSVTAQTEAVEYIRGQYGDKFLPETPPVYKSKKGAQEAHEAIRPTSVKRTPEVMKSFLNEDEFKLYDLIWKKFLASQMTTALDEHISVVIMAGEKYSFKTTGRRNLFPGFAILYDAKVISKKSEDEPEQEDGDSFQVTEELPALKAGEILKLHELLGFQHFTKPPARYNDASLVKLLEENGIGRPSTYAPTIYTLLSREYVNRKGGALMPTELGEIVVDLLVEHFPKVLDAQFTAQMEEELDKIEEGGTDWIKVIKDFYGPFAECVEVAREQMKNFRREAEPTDYKCDLCGKPMVIKWGRFGKFIACSGFPDCKSTRSLPTGHFCPEAGCGGELVKRKSKKRRTFYGCSNYPKCTYIANKLPKSEESISDDEELPETERGTLGP